MPQSIVVLIGLALIHLKTVFCCEMFRFVEANKDQVLEGHVIETVAKSNVALCWNNCVIVSWCFSTNVHLTSEGFVECELNNSSKKANPLKMAAKEGWSYYEMTIPQAPNCIFYDCRRKEDLGDGWRRYGDAAIKLFPEKKKWDDARGHCQSLGGDLLSISTSHENNFVNDVFVKQLNISTFRKDFPDFGEPSQGWTLSQPDSRVQLVGSTVDSVSYKGVDGDIALYFAGKSGYALIPSVNVNPDGFSIAFWMKAIFDHRSGAWIHVIGLLNKAFSLKWPQKVVDFYYKTKDSISVKVVSTARSLTRDFSYWNHFIVSGNKSTGLWHYVTNGTEPSTWTDTSTFPSISGKENFFIGVKRESELLAGDTFHGYLRNMVVINKALDLNEIETIARWNEQGAWIGLNDQENVGSFSWSDGTPVGHYMPFLRDRPNPSVTRRKCIVIGSDGKWLDKLCSMENQYICKKKMND